MGNNIYVDVMNHVTAYGLEHGGGGGGWAAPAGLIGIWVAVALILKLAALFVPAWDFARGQVWLAALAITLFGGIGIACLAAVLGAFY